MTTYRAISDTEVAVDAPITQQLVQALKDNVLAIQEGDATASGVRIQKEALESGLSPWVHIETKTIGSGDATVTFTDSELINYETIKVIGYLGMSGDTRVGLQFGNSGSYDGSSNHYSWTTSTGFDTSDDQILLSDTDLLNGGDDFRIEFTITQMYQSRRSAVEGRIFPTVIRTDSNRVKRSEFAGARLSTTSHSQFRLREEGGSSFSFGELKVYGLRSP